MKNKKKEMELPSHNELAILKALQREPLTILGITKRFKFLTDNSLAAGTIRRAMTPMIRNGFIAKVKKDQFTLTNTGLELGYLSVGYYRALFARSGFQTPT